MKTTITIRLSVEAIAGLAAALPTLIYMTPFSADRAEHRAFVELREALRAKGVDVEQTEPYQE